MTREFGYQDAKREALSLLLSLVGPSFSGKTYSALRLATGIQQVNGGDIAVIDTENKRAAHYADVFKFKHIPLGPPFHPSAYLDALNFCVGKGAGTVIVDSGSHCWESEGGVLEMHERELDRMAGSDWKKRERATFAAWIKPKQEYTRLVNAMLQMPINMIWCFRAKRKLELKRGQQPADLGFVSIAGSEMMYEFQLQALLYPGSMGVPTWHSDLGGEKMMIKLPDHLGALFDTSSALSESAGAAIAKWAAGDVEHPSAESCDAVLAVIYRAESKEEIARIADDHRPKPWSAEQRGLIRQAIEERSAELAGDAAPPTPAHATEPPDGVELRGE